jgi:hypothetical protein
MAGPQSHAQVLPVEVEQDSVGEDSVEGSAEVIPSHVQNPRVVAGLSEPVDEGGGRIGAVDPQPTRFEVLRLPAGPAPEFEYLADGRRLSARVRGEAGTRRSGA